MKACLQCTEGGTILAPSLRLAHVSHASQVCLQAHNRQACDIAAQPAAATQCTLYMQTTVLRLPCEQPGHAKVQHTQVGWSHSSLLHNQGNRMKVCRSSLVMALHGFGGTGQLQSMHAMHSTSWKQAMVVPVPK